MPRQPRIEFEDAVYHVMSRGNHGGNIYTGPKDRELFLKTLSEMCEKTGIVIHAYVLMSNHYHLVLSTPEANLVRGMGWLQSTYTQRYNAKHKLWGHLFQGRYKAIVIDSEEPEYFRIVCNYVHLNPARANLVNGSSKPLSSYKWSSAYCLNSPKTNDPKWLDLNRIIEACEPFLKGRNRRKAYQNYLEERILEERAEKGESESYGKLRRGWCFGNAEFKKELTKLFDDVMGGAKRDSYTGECRKLHDEDAAQSLLNDALELLNIDLVELKLKRKNDESKALLSWFIRKKTPMTLEWLSETLFMGSRANVSRGIKMVEDAGDKRMKAMKQKLEIMYGCAR